jgi:hypothetical protein
MLLASLFFASMGVCVKLASSHFNAFELVFYRGVVSALLMAWLMRARGTPLATPVAGAQAWRSLVGVVSLAAWFYAIGQLPLATAMTLNYMSSIWLGAFIMGGGLLLGRVVAGQGALIAAVLASFAGVVMVLQPTLEKNQLFAGVVGLFSGLLAAVAYLQVTTLGRLGEPAERTVYYFALACAVGGALALESVPLHGAGEALALGGAGDVDVAAVAEDLGRQFLADLVLRRRGLVVESQFGQVPARVDSGGVELTGDRLIDLARADLAVGQLDGAVPVAFGGADPGDDVRPRLDDGDRYDAVVLVEDLGHAQLRAEDSLACA